MKKAVIALVFLCIWNFSFSQTSSSSIIYQPTKADGYFWFSAPFAIVSTFIPNTQMEVRYDYLNVPIINGSQNTEISYGQNFYSYRAYLKLVQEFRFYTGIGYFNLWETQSSGEKWRRQRILSSFGLDYKLNLYKQKWFLGAQIGGQAMPFHFEEAYALWWCGALHFSRRINRIDICVSVGTDSFKRNSYGFSVRFVPWEE